MKIACLQMNSSRDMDANIAALAALVGDAVRAGAQLVATPENTFSMGEPAEGEARLTYAQDDHPGVAAASAIAKTHGCWLLIGSVAISGAAAGEGGQKCFNRSLLFNPLGQIAAWYDKIHLFDVELPGGEVYAESARMLPGGRAVVAPLPWIGLGMSICYDVRFAHLYRALAKAGAGLLAVPAAFTVPTGRAHWHVLLRARAIENGCYVIAPAQVGTHPGGRKTYGHALVIDPWGTVLAEAGEDVGIIMADIDPALVADTRARLPSLQHDRAFVLSDEIR